MLSQFPHKQTFVVCGWCLFLQLIILPVQQYQSTEGQWGIQHNPSIRLSSPLLPITETTARPTLTCDNICQITRFLIEKKIQLGPNSGLGLAVLAPPNPLLNATGYIITSGVLRMVIDDALFILECLNDVSGTPNILRCGTLLSDY